MSADGYGRWGVAKDCTMEHPFGEDRWRPTAQNRTHEHWVNAPDQKYVVFNREEFYRMMRMWHSDGSFRPLEWSGKREALERAAIYDAVVIRTQDALAGSVLHTYASQAALIAHYMEKTDAQGVTFRNIADYFYFRALEADDGPKKLPD